MIGSSKLSLEISRLKSSSFNFSAYCTQTFYAEVCILTTASSVTFSTSAVLKVFSSASWQWYGGNLTSQPALHGSGVQFITFERLIHLNQL